MAMDARMIWKLFLTRCCISRSSTSRFCASRASVANLAASLGSWLWPCRNAPISAAVAVRNSMVSWLKSRCRVLSTSRTPHACTFNQHRDIHQRDDAVRLQQARMDEVVLGLEVFNNDGLGGLETAARR